MAAKRSELKGKPKHLLKCRHPLTRTISYKSRLPKLVNEIVEGCHEDDTLCHLDSTSLPSLEAVVNILKQLESVIFPGYYGKKELMSSYLPVYIGELVNSLFDDLSIEISKAILHENRDVHDEVCVHCEEKGEKNALAFLQCIPRLRELVKEDVVAAYDGDPAARTNDEIITSYPGIKAVTIYRIARVLYDLNVPIIPRMMTEYAHGITGIDIHPGAQIGRSFFIDHGTGVVIGETCQIGDHVQIYQGVTLGALRFFKDDKGELIRGQKRHPTIKDNVTIYSGATILGGKTVVGSGSMVGGNVWLVSSIPDNTSVVIEPHSQKMKEKS